MVLCLARPELLDDRPAWGGGKVNAVSMLLDGLSDEESEALISQVLGARELASSTRARVAEAADGNPLFLEQMLAMLAEHDLSEDDHVLPPTIHALLAARLDRLDPGRARAHRAGVGHRQGVHRGRRSPLSPTPRWRSETTAARALDRLVRRDLVRPAQSDRGEIFRFRHSLIRETAYGAIPKRARAVLHERFATWLDGKATRPGELEEILGYHLEQAYLYRAELGLVDDDARGLAERAAGHLATVGERAYDRGDGPAAANLLSRAVALLAPESRPRLDLLVDLGEALRESGEFREAEDVLGGGDRRRRGARRAVARGACLRRSPAPPDADGGELRRPRASRGDRSRHRGARAGRRRARARQGVAGQGLVPLAPVRRVGGRAGAPAGGRARAASGRRAGRGLQPQPPPRLLALRPGARSGGRPALGGDPRPPAAPAAREGVRVPRARRPGRDGGEVRRGARAPRARPGHHRGHGAPRDRRGRLGDLGHRRDARRRPGCGRAQAPRGLRDPRGDGGEERALDARRHARPRGRRPGPSRRGVSLHRGQRGVRARGGPVGERLLARGEGEAPRPQGRPVGRRDPGAEGARPGGADRLPQHARPGADGSRRGPPPGRPCR